MNRPGRSVVTVTTGALPSGSNRSSRVRTPKRLASAARLACSWVQLGTPSPNVAADPGSADQRGTPHSGRAMPNSCTGSG